MKTWDEHLAKHDKFFNTTQFPMIEFGSNSIDVSGPDTAKISGDLSMLGKTLPLDMNVRLVGSVADHPFAKGRAGIGFSAKGVLKRSDYGMNFLLSPPMVGDDVIIEFEGEFLQVVDQ